MKKIIILVIALALASSVYSQEKLNVLFVGNSYTFYNNLPHLVMIISEGTDTPLNTYRSTIGGAKLQEHWNGLRGLKTRELIESGDFDYVILQDHSMAFMTPDTTIKYVKLFDELVRQHGGKTLLFNTWAREKVPQMQDLINDMYKKATFNTSSKRVVVGDAWQLAMDERPGLDLYSGDGSHPASLGSLLTASMFVRAICSELPDKYPGAFRIKDDRGEEVDLMYADWLDVEFCKSIAEEIYALPLRINE